MPIGFTSTDGAGSLIYADNDSNALAGKNFALTFFVNIGQDVQIRQYPSTIKIDFSRLRESGTRNSFFDFEFKVTGFSLLNMRAIDPFLVSLKNNKMTTSSITKVIKNSTPKIFQDLNIERIGKEFNIYERQTKKIKLTNLFMSFFLWHLKEKTVFQYGLHFLEI